MRIEYDPEADALYIWFREAKPAETVDIEEGITVDLDSNKHLIGIEVLDVRRRFPPETLGSVTVRNVLTSP